MTAQILTIDAEPVGQGQERVCYPHPAHADRLVKVQRGDSDKQTRRELKFYRWLKRRRMDNFDHLPRYYGQVQTNHGKGFVVDLIRDFDGSISQSLYWYFSEGYPVSEFFPYLEELRRYLLDNSIIFSVDMGRHNLLFQRLSAERARLVVIDGLGNHTAINWLDNLAFFNRRKIERRWHRFYRRLLNYSAEMMQEQTTEPRQLDPAYRKPRGCR